MHTFQEVLAALRAHYDQDQLAGVVDRILRVPEAWTALQEPEFLEKVTGAGPSPELTASQLASLALGGDLHSPVTEELVSSHNDRSNQAWEEATVGVAQRDLAGAALLGMEFIKRFGRQGDEMISLVSEAPHLWRSPLAIAWPSMPKSGQFLNLLLANGMETFSIHIVTANFPAKEAGQLLTQSANGSTGRMLQQIAQRGELALARELTLPSQHGRDALADLLIEAVAERFRGEHAAAQKALQQAWATASEASARIADFTAAQARIDGDLVTALEASRKALEILPTAVRRARTALILIELDRAGEALSLVSGPQPSVEELIAGGRAQLQIGSSSEMLLAALSDPDSDLEEDWLAVLVESLQNADMWAAAVDAAQRRAALYPASAAAHFDLARVLLEAGNPESAEEHSALGVALEPQSEYGRDLMASIHHELGEHSKALAEWSDLPGIETSELALHAIEANELELAKQLVEETTPGSRKLALEGMILNATGDRAGARAKYQSAIRKSPNELMAYLELAKSQGGDPDRYHTLSEAVQANPNAAIARIELAKHLREVGRTSEALEAASAAWELDGSSLPLGLLYADLLSQLGHVDRSLEVLRQIAVKHPLSWRVGLALAKAYEARGDSTQAVQSLKPIPSSAPGEAYFDLARITLKADQNASTAIKYLKTAESNECEHPALDYWYGIALEREEQFEEALVRFEKAQSSTHFEIRESAILGTARASLRLGHTSKALAVLEDAQQRYPRSALIAAAMSDVYLHARLPEKAQEAAEKAVALDPEETRAWQALADALANTGDFRGALSAIERLSALDPAATDGWIAMARMANQAKDSKLVRRSIAEALWRGRRSPKSLLDAALVLQELDNRRLAIASLKAAVRSGPGNSKLYIALARAQEGAADYEGAYKSWKACLELTPTEPEALRQCAACAQRLGKSSESVKLLEKAVAIEPGNPWLRRDLAKVHLDQGQVRQGLLAYAGAVKAAPNDASLALEAIETALRSGDPRHALALLGKLDSAATDTGRAQAAMGEAFLLLDKQDQAGAALSEAINQGHATVRTCSMLSLIADDRGQALTFLEQARSKAVESPHDAVWLARAELALLNGEEALEAVEDQQADPMILREKARITLRVRDMLRLFSLAEAVSPLALEEMNRLAEQAGDELNGSGLEAPEISLWQRADEGSGDLEEWMDQDPLGWIGEAIALSHLVRNQADSAEEILARLRLIRSEPEWANILEGLILEARGAAPEARASYRAGSSSNPLAGYLLGKAYETSGNLDRAATHIGAAVVEAPLQHKWQHRLAALYIKLGDSDSALAHFQNAVALDPENSEYLLSLAKAYEASGHFNQALEGYTAALAHSSDSAAAYCTAGDLALRLEAWDLASRWFERAITLSPSDVESLIGSARAAIELGDHKMGASRLKLAQQHSPQDPRVLLGEGHIAIGLDDYPSALSAFERARQAGAELTMVRRAESKLFVRRGQYQQAAEAMREVLDSAPDDHRLWHELAGTYEVGGSLNEAEHSLDEAIRISPANPEYHLSLARVSRKSGNLDRAIEQLGKAEAIASEDPRIPIEAGLVYEDRRDYSRALESYLKAVELKPDSLQAHYRAGILLRTLKAYRRAGEMLKRAAELAPTNQEVMHQLAAVRALELVHG